MNKYVKYLINLIIFLLIVSFLVFKFSWGQFFVSMNNISYTFFICAVVVNVGRQVFAGMRCRYLLKKISGKLGNALLLTIYYIISSFWGVFLPTSIGGDIARGILLVKRYGIKKIDSVKIVLYERVFGLIAICLLLLLGFFFSFYNNQKLFIYADHSDFWVFLFGIIVACFLFWLIFKRFLLQKLNLNFKFVLRVAGILILLSILYQGFSIFAVILLIHAMGLHFYWGYSLLVLPLAWIISMIPFSLNGLMLREGAIVYFYHFFGMSLNSAITLAFLFFLLMLIEAFLGGVFHLVLGFRRSVS